MKSLRTLSLVGSLSLLLVACVHTAAIDADTSAKTGRRDVAPPLAVVDAAAPPLSSAAPLAPVVKPAAFPAGTMAVVAEGACERLDVHPLDNATFVDFGTYQDTYVKGATALVIAQVGADGSIVTDPSYLRGLKRTDADMKEMLPSLEIEMLKGSWPDNTELALGADISGERTSLSTEMNFHWAGDHWVIATPSEPPPVIGETQPWFDGTTMAVDRTHPGYPSFVASSKTVEMPVITELPSSSCDFWTSDMRTRQDEMLVAGLCAPGLAGSPSSELGKGVVLRWKRGEKRSTKMTLPDVQKADELVLHGFVALPNGDDLLLGDDGAIPYIARYDGSTWTRESAPTLVTNSWRHQEADGTIWMRGAGGSLVRRLPTGTWQVEPIGTVDDVLWKDNRPTWVAASALSRFDAGKWISESLPAPAFSQSQTLKPQTLKLGANGDLWIVAKYTETRPGWSRAEERHAIVRRSGAPMTAAPMRCDAAFSPWLPPATDKCSTPLALLARISKSAPKTYDFPQTRKAVRGHTELEGTTFVETTLAGVRFLAAKTKDVATAEQLAQLVASKVAGTRPEVVCGEPEVTRTLGIDLATGKTIK